MSDQALHTLVYARVVDPVCFGNSTCRIGPETVSRTRVGGTPSILTTLGLLRLSVANPCLADPASESAPEPKITPIAELPGAAVEPTLQPQGTSSPLLADSMVGPTPQPPGIPVPEGETVTRQIWAIRCVVQTIEMTYRSTRDDLMLIRKRSLNLTSRSDSMPAALWSTRLNHAA